MANGFYSVPGTPGYTGAYSANMPASYPVPSAPPEIIATPFTGADDEASKYPVGANATVVLMNFGSGYFWVKSAASNGMIQTFDKFKFEKVVEDNPNTVTRKEFDQLSDSVNKICGMLETLMGPPSANEKKESK